MGRLGRPSASWRLVAGGSVAVLLATLLSANVLASPTQKTFTVSNPPTPAKISAGNQNYDIAFTITDNSKTQQIGSIEIALPAGFSFSVDANNSLGSGTSGSSVALAGSLLLFQNLNIAAGTTATIIVGNVVAPGCSPLPWTFTAQQANQWNGSSTANIVYPSSQPTSASAETCQLAFSTQPSDAKVNAQITNTALTPTATPVTVQVVNTAVNPPQPIPVQTSVTLSLNIGQLDYGYSSATLVNGGPVNTDATGAAAFPGLSVNTPGRYQLTATAPTGSNIAPSGPSGQFRIWGTSTTCTQSPCDLSFANGNGENFDVSLNTSTGALGGSLDIVQNFDCSSSSFGGVPGLPLTSAATWTAPNTTATGNKTTIITIPDPILNADVHTSSSTNNTINGLLETHYMVCMSAPGTQGFPVAWTPYQASGVATEDGQMETAMHDGQKWWRGLLPDCQDVNSAPPCVLSRVHGTNSHGVTGLLVTVLTAASDPFGR